MKIDSFNLSSGRVIAKKYEVQQFLGAGNEGEVYKIVELETGIERAAKLFYPQRNPKDKTAKYFAKQLHKLQDCPVVIHYHTKETLTFKRQPITVLISEYVEGDLLSDFIKQFPGKKLSPYQGIHLLYSLAKGIELVHSLNEVHGDLHSDNIIVNKFGLEFELKILDFYFTTNSKREGRKEDLVDLIKILHESLGGAKYYANQPDAIKDICCGLKTSLILKKFSNVSQLRMHLETMSW